MAKNENKKVEEKELFEAPAAEETKVEETEGTEMEMELEMDDETAAEMEELAAENVDKAEKKHQEQKSKRGPKPGNKKDDADGEKKPAKEKALNLKDQNIIQREIKKGRLSAPQGRIEKTDAGYKMLMADGVIFPQDAKGNLKEVATIAKMNDGKYTLTNHASETLKMDKFKAKHENGEEVEHEYVRVELHKPGRDKDVVELFTVKEAKSYIRKQEEITKKKEQEAKKKEEKAKAEKEKAEKEEKDNKKSNKEEATA